MTAIHVLAAMKSISGDCGWRSITDEGRAFSRKRAFRKQPVGQISKSVSSPDRKNIPLSTSSVDSNSSPRGDVGTARLNVDIIESYESPVVSCLRVCVTTQTMIDGLNV